MDIFYWGALLGCSGAAFLIGLGVGGLIVVARADAHTAAFLRDAEKDGAS